jgi:hypothetical protein
MSWKEVKDHDIAWYRNAKEDEKGEIKLLLEEEKSVKSGRLTYEDYSAMAGILHCGKRIWYEDKHAILKTSNEKPKEIPSKKIKIPDVASFSVFD